MKRRFIIGLFTLVFAAVNLLPAATVLAATCQHLHHANDTAYRSEFVNIGDGSQHKKVVYYQHSCTDCRVALPDVTVDIMQSHTFSGSTCSKCSYTKVCGHQNHANDTAYDYKFVNTGDSSQHQKIIYYRHSCTDCGQALPDITNEVTAAHTFSGSTCSKCGYTKAAPPAECTHSHHANDTAYDYKFINTGDSSQHQKIIYYRHSCTDCGQALPDVTSEVTAAHTFSGSTCSKCGYTKSAPPAECTHSHHANDTAYDYKFISTGDSSQHKKIIYYRHSCTDCGKALPDVTSEVTAVHEFSGNTCMKCGYTKTETPKVCPHQNHANDTAYNYEFVNTGDSFQHKKIIYYRHSCIDCGQALPDVTSEVTAAHTFSGSTCSKCGYTKTETPKVCPHQNHANDTAYDYKFVNTGDSFQHQKIICYRHSCTDCGEALPDVTGEATAAHEFSGNTCTKCGYTKNANYSINIVSPNENVVFNQGDTVSIKVSATGLKYVQIYVKNTTTGSVDNPGGTFNGQDNCSTTWSTSGKTPGKYLIKAQGCNVPNQNLVEDRLYIIIEANNKPVENQAPVMTVVKPSPGTEFKVGDKIKIEASATDDVKVAAMAIYINREGNARARVSGNNVSYEWDTSGLSAGWYSIKVTAYDGYKADEKIVGVRLADGDEFPVDPNKNRAPVVAISSPIDGAAFKAGDQVKIEASATDDVKVTGMGIYVNNEGTSRARESKDSISYTWDTTGLADGWYSIRVTAFDGSKFDQKIVKVKVGDASSREEAIPDVVEGKANPDRGYAGQEFVFTARVKNNPKYVYIQFSNGDEWLDKDACRNNFRFEKQGDARDGTASYRLKMKISSPGVKPDDRRSFRIYAANDLGESQACGGTFVVHPNEKPSVTIEQPKPDQVCGKGQLNVKARSSSNTVAMNLYQVVSGQPDKPLLKNKVEGNEMDVKVPFDTSGYYTLKVTAVNVQNESSEATVDILVGDPKPQVTGGPTPSAVSYGAENQTIKIQGNGFITKTCRINEITFEEKISGKQIPARDFRVEAEQVTITVPKDLAIGKYDIYLKSKAGLTKASGFEVKAPKNLDTLKPEIKIITPQDKYQIGKGTLVLISAAATDNDEVVAMGIEIDGVKVAKSDFAVILKTWDTHNVELGTYSIRITAIDPGGLWNEKFINVNIVEPGSYNPWLLDNEKLKAAAEISADTRKGLIDATKASLEAARKKQIKIRDTLINEKQGYKGIRQAEAYFDERIALNEKYLKDIEKNLDVVNKFSIFIDSLDIAYETANLYYSIKDGKADMDSIINSTGSIVNSTSSIVQVILPATARILGPVGIAYSIEQDVIKIWDAKLECDMADLDWYDAVANGYFMQTRQIISAGTEDGFNGTNRNLEQMLYEFSQRRAHVKQDLIDMKQEMLSRRIFWMFECNDKTILAMIDRLIEHLSNDQQITINQRSMYQRAYDSGAERRKSFDQMKSLHKDTSVDLGSILNDFNKVLNWD